MPGRKIPIITGEFYHILNRGVASQPTFLSKRDYQRASLLLPYYQHLSPPFKFSRFLKFSKTKQSEVLQMMRKHGNLLVEIVAYCLMPNHFHFILKQLSDEGISKFVSDVTNSYTRYFNTKYERKGPIFQGKFKAVRVETEEQLLHLSRYIHLNPLSSYVVKTTKDLENYSYSSFPEYLQEAGDELCQKGLTLNNFKTASAYKDFVLDRADYQQKLQDIKHLTLEQL
jgi:putative transposase